MLSNIPGNTRDLLLSSQSVVIPTGKSTRKTNMKFRGWLGVGRWVMGAHESGHLASLEVGGHRF